MKADDNAIPVHCLPSHKLFKCSCMKCLSEITDKKEYYVVFTELHIEVSQQSEPINTM